MSIALRISDRRKQLKLSRQDLADITGLDQKQIWRYETSRNDPTGTVIIAIAHALDVSTDWLLGLSDEMKPFQGEDKLSEMEREALNLLRSKSPDGQKRALEMLKLVV